MFNTVLEAIEDIRNGKMVIVVDDENRENEGDLICAGEHTTPENVNFMIKHARGLVCTAISKEIADRLNLSPMVTNNTDRNGTAFTYSIDYMDTTTGISAFERSLSIMKMMEDNTTGADFRSPGHVFPLIAKEMGVLERMGHTEAAVDLARLAGLKGAGTICEIVKEDGTMARVDDLMDYKEEHDLKIITIEALKKHLLKEKMTVEAMGETLIETKYGDFTFQVFQDKNDGKEHLAITNLKGDEDVVNVRIHSECMTGDLFGSQKCDCGDQLAEALRYMDKNGGMVIYMRQEGRGIGLANKLKAYNLQRQGMDTIEANLALGFEEDMREYDIPYQVLNHYGIEKINLFTNNPDKIKAMEDFGLEVTRKSLYFETNEFNEKYIQTKIDKMGHMIG